ncbi:EamA family transporter [Fodinicurvata sp. EGI_FJ10296]|uniref:DMT family transporter n=1 Tax=Fodinicurvata sp. EGI_FJ10296 TaxID=3231908 RepID=UPI0034529695
MKARDLLIVLLIMAVWGFNFAVSKVALEQIPPIFMIGLRFAVVAALLLPITRIPTEHMKDIFLLSVTLGSAHFALMFTGLSRVDASVAAITIQVQVPIAAALGALLYREPVTTARVVGMVIAAVGVVILAGAPQAQSDLSAVLMIVGAAFMWAVATMQMKRLSNVNGFQLNAWMALFATPQLLFTSLMVESGQWEAITAADWRVWASIAYQAVLVVVVCYSLWYWLLRKYEVSQAIPFTLLVPVFGVMSGLMFLGEVLTWNVVVGGGTTIAGVAIITGVAMRFFDWVRSRRAPPV